MNEISVGNKHYVNNKDLVIRIESSSYKLFYNNQLNPFDSGQSFYGNYDLQLNFYL